MTVYCDSNSEFNECICVFNYLIRESRISYDRDPTKLLILKHWMKADANNDGQLDYKVCNNLKIISVVNNDQFYRKWSNYVKS